MGTPESSREPCPERILDDFGGAFSIGAIGGSIFHFIRGSLNTPRGERLSGGFQAVRTNSPRVGGSFAVWGGLFSAVDCSIVYIRQKEDPWNSILAGASTSGLLAMRAGLGPASRAAAFGGMLLAGIEGVGIMANQLASAQQNAVDDPSMNGISGSGFGIPGQQRDGEVEGKRWLGGLFGGKKEEGSGSSGGGGGSETKVLESFDSPTPIPNFDFK